jgi:hypothetical protein
MGRLIGMEDLATAQQISVSHAGKIQRKRGKNWIGLYLGTVRNCPYFQGQYGEHLPFSPDWVS